jgi:hypothetical protein
MSLGTGMGPSLFGPFRSFVQHFPDDPVRGGRGAASKVSGAPIGSTGRGSGFRVNEDIDLTEGDIIQPGLVDEGPSKHGLPVQWPWDVGTFL